jgi:2-dehydropantoate 2-reductase
MKIAVFGAGAVGSFYGGLLARGGQDVHIVARGAQLEALGSHGLRISSLALGEISVPPLRATSRAADIGTADLVLVCVKAHQTAGILDDLRSLTGEHTVLIALQNGVESDEILASRFGAEKIVSAVVYVGAELEQPGLVRHVAAGTLVIGERDGSTTPRIERIRDALAATGLPVRISPDIERQRWHKLTWNASFNAVSALTLRSSQELLAVGETRELLLAIMREVVAVARGLGVTLGESDLQQLVAATERAAPIRTSMLVDRERGRQLETDALVGVVVRKGRQLGIPTPITSALHALLTAVDVKAGVTERAAQPAQTGQPTQVQSTS